MKANCHRRISILNKQLDWLENKFMFMNKAYLTITGVLYHSFVFRDINPVSHQANNIESTLIHGGDVDRRLIH